MTYHVVYSVIADTKVLFLKYCKHFEKRISSMVPTHRVVPAGDGEGIPKTIYSDQGSEFKNNTFQKLLDKHNIQIIFALGHAPFVESFNKTMNNRMMKYMKLKNTDNRPKVMGPVLDAYNNNPHSITTIATNKVNKENEIQVKMNIHKRAKIKSNYPKLEVGDNVRVPVINKVHQGYKDQFSMEIHKVEKSVWMCSHCCS